MTEIDAFRLDGRVAFVTGAARGIGEAIARQLGGRGAMLLLADTNPAVHDTVERLRQDGLRAEATVLDVTDRAAVDGAAAQAVARHGAVDILVANAGISYEVATLDHTDDEWRRVMAINLDGVFYAARAFGSHMVRQGRGAIVAISSIAGVKFVRPEIHLGYDVSKAGVAHLCRVLGCEWGARGVRVNAVGPGYTDTDMLAEVGRAKPEVLRRWLDDTPMGRLMRRQEIANAVAFLASDAASGITGQLLMVDGGYSAA